MLYQEYHEQKEKYKDAQRLYDSILSEKETLFQRTQPNAVDTSKEKVSGGKQTNAFDAYLIEVEEKKIDQRLSEAKSLMADREKLLRAKREELRSSNEIEDRIYRYRYIERMRIYRIAKMVSYSERQVKRILEQIRDSL